MIKEIEIYKDLECPFCGNTKKVETTHLEGTSRYTPAFLPETIERETVSYLCVCGKFIIQGIKEYKKE